MFDSINQRKVAKVGIWFKPSKRDGVAGVIGIPNGAALSAIDQLWRMLEWTCQSCLTDCDSAPLSPEDWTDPADLDEYMTRNRARILSYIQLTCLIEGILGRAYRESHVLLHRYFKESPDLKGCNTIIADRKKEVRLVFDYRNKLAAHTSFADPKDDTPEQQWSSLLALTAGCYEPNGFSVGGIQAIHSSKRRQNTNTVFARRFVLREQHDNVVRHFSNWKDSFCSLVEPFARRCPFEVDEYKIVGSS